MKNILSEKINNLLFNKNDSERIILLEKDNAILDEENKYLKQQVNLLEEINIDIMKEKALLSFNNYREINSLADKIKNLREKQYKTDDDYNSIRELLGRYIKLENKLKNNNLMQSLLKSQHLVSFLIKKAKQNNLNELLDSFDEERRKIQHQKWGSIIKV